MRGLQEAVDYYRLLLAELEQRVAAGVAAVEGERLRIYWEGMPIWGKLSSLGTQFLELQRLRRRLDLLQQLDLRGPRSGRSVPQHGPGVQQHLHLPVRRPTRRRTSSRWWPRFKVDGILYHDAKTCPNNSNSRYGLPQRLDGRLGKPYLVDQRRPERPAALLRRADADEHRGVRGAAAGAGVSAALNAITLDALFRPRSVAVIGALGTRARDRPFGDRQPAGVRLHRCDLSGASSAPEIRGLKAYPNLEAIPGEVDLAHIIIPSTQVPTMAECGARVCGR